jgi:hypothetical protein
MSCIASEYVTLLVVSVHVGIDFIKCPYSRFCLNNCESRDAKRASAVEPLQKVAAVDRKVLGIIHTYSVQILYQEFETRKKHALHKEGCRRQFLHIKDFDLRRISIRNSENDQMGRRLDQMGAASEFEFLNQAYPVVAFIVIPGPAIWGHQNVLGRLSRSQTWNRMIRFRDITTATLVVDTAGDRAGGIPALSDINNRIDDSHE